MRKHALVLVTIAATLCSSVLSGCTTIASGVAVGPPGVNRYSFRECLLDNGFYTPTALTGIALQDYRYRHVDKPAEPTPTRQQLLEQNGATFVIGATRIIGNGLMPSVEYWPPVAAETLAGPVTAPDALDSDGDGTRGGTGGRQDAGVNAPYVLIPAAPKFLTPVFTNPKGANPSGDDQFATNLTEPDATSATRPDWKLNRFLDCYVAPVGAGAWPGEKGDDDVEGRLLRGHILLTMLAQFGTELVISHPSRRQVAQAELLLGHITDAERALRSGSLVINDALLQDPQISKIATLNGTTLTIQNIRGKAQVQLQWYNFVTRLLRVFQVGVDIERIDAEQSLDRASNLIAAFGGAIQGFLPILKDGLAGFATVQKTKIYGDAYLRDARETLAVHRSGTTIDSTKLSYDADRLKAGWALWDEQLVRACTVLATVAKKDVDGKACTPSPSQAAS